MNILEFLNEWGVVVGGLIVLLIAAFGTYCRIRSANGTKERASRVKYAIRTWIFLAAVLGLIFGLQYVFPGLWSFLNEWGADLGVSIGLLCPYIGDYRRTMNINGPKERAFAVKCFVWSLVGSVLLLGLFVGLRFAPQPYNACRFLLLLLIIPYVLIDIPLNRRQAQIRAEESPEKSP